LSAKVAADDVWRERVDALVATGVDEKAAKKQVKVRIPRSVEIDKARVRVRGTSQAGRPAVPLWSAAEQIFLDGGCEPEVATRILGNWAGHCADPAVGIQPWAPEVPNSVIQRGEKDADVAWGNWKSSLAGKRKGRRVGHPRFKSKVKSRDSFYLANTETGLVDGAPRRLRLGGKLGAVRTCEPLRRLRRALQRRAGRILSVTVSRGGHHWYACVLLEESIELLGPSRRQVAAGTVGVDLGVKVAAALSTGEIIDNPQIGKDAAPRLRKAQRAKARTQKGSARHRKAARRVGEIQHRIAERRATFLHALTKRLATDWAVVALEDLNVAGMTRSSKGTVEKPGKKVRQKAGLNRSILDVSFGELRRQVTYKSVWYGSKVAICGRYRPSSKTCSNCGAAKAKLKLSERTYRCDTCGTVLDRDVNAAVNIAAWGVVPVASDMGETENGREGPAVGVDSMSTEAVGTSKRQGRPPGRPPCGSDAASPP
jgi:putative transposase